MKATPELLKAMGWIYNKKHDAYFYPDIETAHAWIDIAYIHNFTLKQAVNMMILEQKVRLKLFIEQAITNIII